MDQWWSDWLFLVLGGVLGLKPVLPGKRWHPERSCVFVQLGTRPKCNHMWRVYMFICTCKILSIISFRYTCTYTYAYILSHNTCIYTPLIEGWMQVPLVNFSCLWFLQILNQNRLPLCFLRCAGAVDANYPSTLGLLGLVMPLGSGTQFIHDSLMATFQQLMSWRFLFCLQLIHTFDVWCVPRYGATLFWCNRWCRWRSERQRRDGVELRLGFLIDWWVTNININQRLVAVKTKSIINIH